jgi:hypothetical protein
METFSPDVIVFRSTKILYKGQFITHMCKFISQSDEKHIMTSPIKTITSVLKASRDNITNIPARISDSLISDIMSVETFSSDVIVFIDNVIM